MASYLILVAQGLIYDVLIPFANKLSPSEATLSWETFHGDLHLKKSGTDPDFKQFVGKS